VPIEVTTVTAESAVLFDGGRSFPFDHLEPDTAYERLGVSFSTLPRPPGERLATVTTVNDVHFGETECGVLEGLDVGPVLRSSTGEDPYPEVMNRAAIEEMAYLQPDAVVAKGDLTAIGSQAEYDAFLSFYGAAFGDRLHWVRGNHDGELAAFPTQEVVLPGVILAILDTVIPGRPSGRLSADELDWLDQLGHQADRPVLMFGHHHVFDPESRNRPETYFGINPDDSEQLVAVVARRPALVGYFAGHTHRNRVRHFGPTGQVPWVEVACVKDFPGTWAEYQIYEGGVLQIHHRIASPDALAWSEACRAMIGGLYPAYAMGQPADRCFAIWPR
jgi:3',5'-cyclic AMP phosphodiesterase CpdA